MRLRLSPLAERDLENLHHYGTVQYGAGRADAYLLDLLSVLEEIAEAPMAMAARPIVQPPVRMRPFRGRNIIYDVADAQVTILRILHQFQLARPIVIVRGAVRAYMSDAARHVRNFKSPGPYRSLRELSLAGPVGPDIRRPPTCVGSRDRISHGQGGT